MSHVVIVLSDWTAARLSEPPAGNRYGWDGRNAPLSSATRGWTGFGYCRKSRTTGSNLLRQPASVQRKHFSVCDNVTLKKDSNLILSKKKDEKHRVDQRGSFCVLLSADVKVLIMKGRRGGRGGRSFFYFAHVSRIQCIDHFCPSHSYTRHDDSDMKSDDDNAIFFCKGEILRNFWNPPRHRHHHDHQQQQQEQYYQHKQCHVAPWWLWGATADDSLVFGISIKRFSFCIDLLIVLIFTLFLQTTTQSRPQYACVCTVSIATPMQLNHHAKDSTLPH